jgi:hypothetical protein
MRSCENCGGKLVRGATSCPACGVYAGEISEEGKPLPKRSRKPLVFAIVIPALVLGGLTLWLEPPWKELESPQRIHSAPVRVVRDRPGGVKRAPGATLNQAEAVRLLRRHLVHTETVTDDCLVVIGNGFRDGAYQLIAHNRCDRTKLGRWQVHGTTRTVSRSATMGKR